MRQRQNEQMMQDCTFSPRIAVTSFSKKLKGKVGNRSGKAFLDAQEVFLAKKENKMKLLRHEQKIDEK